MKTIYLHGELAKEYGSDVIEIDADTPFMIMRGLVSRFGKKFEQTIRDGVFEFKCTDTQSEKIEFVTGDDPKDEETIMGVMRVVECDRIDLTPVVEGSGKFGSFIIGVVFIAAWYFTGMTQAWMLQVGIGFIVGGVAQLLMPVPKIDNMQNEQPDKRASFLFNGPVNVQEQGVPVPLVYGRVLAGSVVVSAGFTVEQIPYNSNECGRVARKRFDCLDENCGQTRRNTQFRQAQCP